MTNAAGVFTTAAACPISMTSIRWRGYLLRDRQGRCRRCCAGMLSARAYAISITYRGAGRMKRVASSPSCATSAGESSHADPVASLNMGDEAEENEDAAPCGQEAQASPETESTCVQWDAGNDSAVSSRDLPDPFREAIRAARDQPICLIARSPDVIGAPVGTVMSAASRVRRFPCWRKRHGFAEEGLPI